jgi:hypothetical protein
MQNYNFYFLFCMRVNLVFHIKERTQIEGAEGTEENICS